MAEVATITTRIELDRAFEESARGPVIIFKHSLICPVSTVGYETYREFLKDRNDGGLYTLIEIQKARELSNAVAERTGVRHESPQAVLLHQGKAVWSASHWDISPESLEAAVEQARA
jgi:bacillithiol system protein YtxJ